MDIQWAELTGNRNLVSTVTPQTPLCGLGIWFSWMCHLTDMKITLTSPFIRYTNLKYLEISQIRFIQRNHHGLQRRLWNLTNLSLFKLVNTAIILAFSSSLILQGTLLVSCSTMLHTRRELQHGVRQPNVGGNMVGEIFLLPPSWSRQHSPPGT